MRAAPRSTTSRPLSFPRQVLVATAPDHRMLRPRLLGSARLPPLLPRSRRALSAKALPAAVDAVVVGGGVVGTAVAYNLQRRGLSTLLIEAHNLTAGTTWHTAGMLWRLRPSYVDIELHTRTRELAIELEAEPGAAWTENGGLFIACNKERLSEYERLAQTGAKYGIESSVLSPSECKAVHPLLNVEDVYGEWRRLERSSAWRPPPYPPIWCCRADPHLPLAPHPRRRLALAHRRHARPCRTHDGLRARRQGARGDRGGGRARGRHADGGVHDGGRCGGDTRRLRHHRVRADRLDWPRGQRVRRLVQHAQRLCGRAAATARDEARVRGHGEPRFARHARRAAQRARPRPLHLPQGAGPGARDRRCALPIGGTSATAACHSRQPQPPATAGLPQPPATADVRRSRRCLAPGYESNPEFWLQPEKDFAFGLFDLDWDTFLQARAPPRTSCSRPPPRDLTASPPKSRALQNTEGHIQRCPPIESVGIASTVCGPEAFTPDHKPLVGPQPGVRGFWQSCARCRRRRPASLPTPPASHTS